MKNLRILSVCLAALGCAVLALRPAEGAVVETEATKVNSAEETFAQTEKRFKKLVNDGFKLVLPYVMSAATELRLNGKCMRGLLMLVSGVMDIKDWAIKMVDALGKPSAGILEGTSISMGDYDECLDITVPKKMRPVPVPPYSANQVAFHGQYCVVQINLPESIKKAAMAYQIGNRSNSELANTQTFLRNFVKLAPRADVAELRLGVCIPSICDKNDLQAIVNQISDIFKMSSTAIRCETKQKKTVSVEQIVILSIIGVIGFLVVFGTFVDTMLDFKRKDVSNDEYLKSKNVWIQWIVAFSITRNSRQLFSLTTSEGPKLTCLRGMKLISVCVYVVVWTYATPQDFHFMKFRSAFYLHKFLEEWWFTVFANASAGVDTLFFIAGLHLSYRLWRKSKNGKVTVNIPKFILKWVTRYILSQAMVICLFLCLPLIGKGPIWADVVTPVIENCKQRWWLNLLALNNFWPSDETCLPHTWLACCMFHMLLLAPILLFILSKSTTVGVFVNVIIIIGSGVAIAMVTLIKNLPPAPSFYFMSFINIKTIWQTLFIQSYDHIGPFCLGILLGFFLSRNDKVRLSKTTVTFGWCCTIVCNLAVICGLYGYRHGEEMELTLSAVYASVHRTVWAMGIAWMVFACAYGYGGFVNKFLSSQFLIPFDRLLILTYLLHPLILFLHEGQLRERMYMAHLDQAMYATAYIVFTIVVAALCYVTCVGPFYFFEKKLWYTESETSNEVPELKEVPEKSDVCKEKVSIQGFQYTGSFSQRYCKTPKT